MDEAKSRSQFRSSLHHIGAGCASMSRLHGQSANTWRLYWIPNQPQIERKKENIWIRLIHLSPSALVRDSNANSIKALNYRAITCWLLVTNVGPPPHLSFVINNTQEKRRKKKREIHIWVELHISLCQNCRLCRQSWLRVDLLSFAIFADHKKSLRNFFKENILWRKRKFENFFFQSEIWSKLITFKWFLFIIFNQIFIPNFL